MANDSSRRFLSGVVEGFYGRPWTMEQRKELFRREQKWGLNTYLYAPKDDYKHRMYWRDLYSPAEAEQLVTLISTAKKHNIEFIYAISPGLDITFSNPKEVATLKRKLDQVSEFGCRSFALLFDDIETEMCPADKEAFSSFAHAQVAVTNEVFQHLPEPDTFLFCPTDYCAAFCMPSVNKSSYLHTVGETLLPGIDVLWTGPKVVSKEISVESIKEVSGVLKRAPVIWDNIHANDFDPQRVMMGPFKDRPTELLPNLRGVLTNPNCEFELNFVAIHTLATWCKSDPQRDVSMDGEDNVPDYVPQEALRLALSEWLVEFGISDQHGGSRKRQPKKESSEEEPMQTDPGYIPGPRENPLYTAEPLTLDDLMLLSQLFYLPYEHGPTAITMLQELNWLKSNSDAAGFGPLAPDNSKAVEWRTRADQFDQMCEAVVQMFNRLSNVPNRSILYDLYNYICDIKSGVSMARAYVKSLGGLSTPSVQPMNDDPEPWGFRGGLSGEFQRMLPSLGNRDLFRQPSASRVYTIRPYTPDDQSAVQRIQNEMQSEGTVLAPAAHIPDLLGHRLASGQISSSPKCAFLLEDELGICAYALGLTEAKLAMTSNKYPEVLLRDYPAFITVQILPRVPDPIAAKRLVGNLLSALRANGCRSAFCEFRQGERRTLDFFTKLGSFRVLDVERLPKHLLVMGTSL
ncbi:protein O-GlcNAcase isoform X1 [Denticeps clupeoides]|uniref:protein O-GlcNAcase isoform X1 n=1 Tax=Denticeps clupeoides TaxID=299321 RepID=UPI0010A4794B|nr:protein O-GlcNAcase-like isoform X1 [Denticeps clupeoides]